jgi:hypothetical protein
MCDVCQENVRPPVGPQRLRRLRQQAPRRWTVRFDLTDAEFAELNAAAVRAGLAAEAMMAAARSAASVAADDGLRDVLAALIRAAGLVRRMGVNLNQAVAKLNATGQRFRDLLPYGRRPSLFPAPGRCGRPGAEGAPVTFPRARPCSFRPGQRVPTARNGRKAFGMHGWIIWTVWMASGPLWRIVRNGPVPRRIAAGPGWAGPG